MIVTVIATGFRKDNPNEQMRRDRLNQDIRAERPQKLNIFEGEGQPEVPKVQHREEVPRPQQQPVRPAPRFNEIPESRVNVEEKTNVPAFITRIMNRKKKDK